MSSLDPALRQALAETLKAVPKIRCAIVFGSLAAMTARGESDLDIAIDAGHPLTAAEKMKLIEDLAATTGRPIDLVDLQTAGEPVLGQILKNGIRILGNTCDYAGLIRRHVFDNSDFGPYRERILRQRKRAWIGN